MNDVRLMMTEEQALEQITTYVQGQFPQKAVDHISSHWDLYEDRLIDILRAYAQNPELYSLEKDDYWSALFLLGQFQSQKAFPVILDLLKTLPYSFETDSPLGDILTEFVPPILAACFDGKLEQTHDLLYCKDSYLFSRGTIPDMIEICLYLGKIDEQTALTFFEDTIHGLMANDPEDDFLEMFLDDLAGLSLDKFDEIVTQKDIVLNEFLQGEIDYLKSENTPKPYYLSQKGYTLKRYHALTKEGMNLMKEWPIFSEEAPDDDGFWDRNLSQGFVNSNPMTMHNHHNIGRNDSCFCGSGKKFKKCCLQ
jgi:uncharacterized protein DUF1186/SEC-C motif-containing protein